MSAAGTEGRPDRDRKRNVDAGAHAGGDSHAQGRDQIRHECPL